MVHGKSIALLITGFATLAPARLPAPAAVEEKACKTIFDHCTGQLECRPSTNCTLGCETVLVSTPYGIGATCRCKDSPDTEVCCDLVVLPGGDAPGFAEVGECPFAVCGFKMSICEVWRITFYNPPHADYDYQCALCVPGEPPPPPPGW